MKTGSSRSSRRDEPQHYLFAGARTTAETWHRQRHLALYRWRTDADRPQPQTVFFTDRAIYRPGQTIQYKGICLWVGPDRDNYDLLKGEQVTVVFNDPTARKSPARNIAANDFGSFAGSFTAPRDRLMGRMRFEVEGRALGDDQFSVEEYKRPKFQVTLEAPKTAPPTQRAGDAHRARH